MTGAIRRPFRFSGKSVGAQVRSVKYVLALVWVDRTGKATPVGDALRRYSEVRLSPDGRKAALTIAAENRDIWILDLERGTSTRATFGPASEFAPVWTPDGRRLVFSSERPVFEMFWKSASGTGAEEPLAKAKHDRIPWSVSPDGKLVVFTERQPQTSQDISVAPLDGKGEPKALLATSFVEDNPRLSPDGRWLAYISNESGRNEVYAIGFPEAAERDQKSTLGGEAPVWRGDGREIL
jgi:Tol biopolymer transport system component